jgi:hypothetical protein
MLRLLTVADWPNMKQSRREELHRKLHKTAYPSTYSKPVTLDTLAQLLQLGTIN